MAYASSGHFSGDGRSYHLRHSVATESLPYGIIPVTMGILPVGRHSRSNGNLIQLDPRVKPEDDAVLVGLGPEDDVLGRREMTRLLG